MSAAWTFHMEQEKPLSNTQTFEFSDVSKEIEEATGIEGIDLFPGIRKWKATQQAEKVVAVIPPEIRGLVVRKLVVSILTSIFGRK